MPATQAKAGAGLTLSCGSPSFTVPEMRNLNWSGRIVEFADATHFLSPDFYNEKVATFKDPGELSFETNYIPDDSAYASMDALYESRQTASFTLSHSEWTGSWTFSAFISELSPLQAGPKDIMVSSVKLTLAGAPSFA
jgi:hypothetical protein